MSRPVVIVGSGASGVHAALSILEGGGRVLMLDVGRTPPEMPLPDATFEELKDRLPDPRAYFLGDDLRGVVLPDLDAEYYGIPPGKDYVFAGLPHFATAAEGFAPLLSWARGGLAEAWTGGSYPYAPEELAGFPAGAEALVAWYGTVAARVGIAGASDDLRRFMPAHEHLLPPLDLDEHSRRILDRYAARRAVLNGKHGFYLGRSRIAVLRGDQGERGGCTYSGRCLWGCPRESLYTPSVTLRQCRRFPGFEYRSGWHVSHFEADASRRITSVVAAPVAGGDAVEIPVDELVLAAGTLSTGRIFLESWRRATGEVLKLRGLMDNRQILVPFVNLGMIGKRPALATYQYHQLAVGLAGRTVREHVHGQITTLKAALIHPVVQGLPVGLRTAVGLFRQLHAALGLLNVNFADDRREGNWLSLDPERRAADGSAALAMRYQPPAGEEERLRETIGRCRRALRVLGCIVVPGMVHVRPMGASVHYAGTLPMTASGGPLTTGGDGRSRDFRNLTIVDGSIFPALSAKQLTFTMMANAARVGAAVARQGG